MKFLFVLLTLFLFQWEGISKEVPSYNAPVLDQANIIGEKEESIINQALYELNQNQKIQFQVYTFLDLDDETIESYSIKVADQWKIGNQSTDKGALLLIALNNKKIRIEVGQGLEGDLTDIKSKQIVREISKFFKGQNYSEGIVTGLALMAQVSKAELKLSSNVRPRHHRKTVSPIFILLLVGIFIFIQMFAPRRRGFHGHGSYDGGPFIGGGGFSGGSGGGWSGGGGGFSGGGASGDW